MVATTKCGVAAALYYSEPTDEMEVAQGVMEGRWPRDGAWWRVEVLPVVGPLVRVGFDKVCGSSMKQEARQRRPAWKISKKRPWGKLCRTLAEQKVQRRPAAPRPQAGTIMHHKIRWR